MNSLKSFKFYLFLTCFILFLIPFFWLRPGEMDLGGDGSRLYFYDPINYLQNNVLYAVQPIGTNNINPLYLFLPFNILLIGVKAILKSPYLIMSLFNSFHLIVAFLSMYGITRWLLLQHQKEEKWGFLIEVSALVVGLYYTFSPLMVRTEWDRAIFTHARIFLGPLIFYLLLRFFQTAKAYYILIALLVTFVFSTNFSWGGAPSLFSFYPITLLYLFLYTRFIRKQAINVKALAISFVLYILIHAFHLVPFLSNILDQSGLAYQKIFSAAGKFDTGLEYFLGSAQHIRLLDNLLGLPQLVPSVITYEVVFFVVPVLLLFGLLVNQKLTVLVREQRKNYLLLFLFFLIATFFATANITNIGIDFYKSLFNIPGFSMFRNYYGQWALPYLFFLSLLLGQAFFYVLLTVKKRFMQTLVSIFFVLLIITSAFPFIRGDMINTTLNKGEKIEFQVPIKIDSTYEQVLTYVRDIPIDGKFVTFPHSESFNQVLIGSQGGMYIGPSTIGQLAGKSDFNGYQVFPPFNEVFLLLAQEKDYRSLGVLLGLLNVKYAFYNTDPLVLDVFPNFPYAQYLRQFLPDKQKDYQIFVESLPLKKEQTFGRHYYIYSLDDSYYLPHIYIPKKIEYFEKKLNPWNYLTEAFFRYKTAYETRTTYLEDRRFVEGEVGKVPRITFTKINPTKYYIEVSDVDSPYLLVFSDSFHPQWKLFLSDADKNMHDQIVAEYFQGEIKEGQHKSDWFNKSTFETWGKSQIADDKHIMANGYANAWYITPSDTSGRSQYTLILEMRVQQIFYIALFISLFATIVCSVSLLVLLLKSRK